MAESKIAPSLDQIRSAVPATSAHSRQTLIPICMPIDFSSPLSAFQKLCAGDHSFLWEVSTPSDPTITQYSVVGLEPFAILRTGPKMELKGDPLHHLERVMSQFEVPTEFRIQPGILNGAAFGYITYDCVRYFETKVDQYIQPDVLDIPESLFMFTNSFAYFDHLNKSAKLVVLCPISHDIADVYAAAVQRLHELSTRLGAPEPELTNTRSPGGAVQYNAGEAGYKAMVTKLKERIVDGDIIQAVPSHRVSRPTGVHPFNLYKQLRALNPSRYMFFVECAGFHIVGSSPELLMRIQDGEVENHPIAGTRPRGKTPEEDAALEQELLADEKERAEHIMLVDLGRNDINRVSKPASTTVTSLMHVERYSHVMHIVSRVVGSLREDCSVYDAFRSIFPAGTLSGAPKVKAMELIAQLEPDRRGVYGGAVGAFCFDGSVDTAIAIRTILMKNGVCHLQAGGGIVLDSLEEAEYQETVNKMAATMRAVDLAEATGVHGSTPADGVKAISPLSLAFNSRFLNTTGATSNQPTARAPGSTSIRSDDVTLMVDNFDSFTWNIYQYLCQLGANVVVLRNDVSLDTLIAINPARLVISPGPGWPHEAGVSNAAIKHFAGKIPILGVCLGHECITEIYGGKIVHAGEVLHGKTSKIYHDGKGLFKGVPDGVEAIRYHSLAADPSTIDSSILEVTSKTSKGIIMGLRHKHFKMECVQFHPESIKTEYGMQMLKNFLEFQS